MARKRGPRGLSPLDHVSKNQDANAAVVERSEAMGAWLKLTIDGESAPIPRNEPMGRRR
jgi:hypothetical protein